MGKSISTTSNTQTNTTPATFKAGDSVLCPSVGSGTYQLFNDKEYGCLGFTTNGKTYHYRNDGKVSRGDATPSIFHDTEANRQAIAILYSGHRNSTDNIVMPAATLASIASEIDCAGQALHDVSILLHMIYKEKITPQQVIAMTRLSHDATNAWAEILCSSLESINQTLSSTRFGQGGA